MNFLCDGLTDGFTSRINIIAVWRIIANKATSDNKPDPMWIFPTIILLGETENRLSLALASIPIFWPVVSRTWQNLVIVVTHEVRIESNQRPPNVGEIERTSLGNCHHRVITEDEANEAGLRHPGRLCDVDGYEMGLISPFAEPQSSKQTQPEKYLRDISDLERRNLGFVTVPDISE